MKYVNIEMRMYGDFKCSKCGDVLDGPSNHLVTTEDDEDECYNARCFCPSCWSKISAQPLADIFNNFKVSEEA